MLAYELYLKNKESTGEVVKKTKPIKKIFVNKNNIKIDNKTREEYGSELTNDQGFIQDWLSMPLNTSNTKLLNLPDKRTGSRSSPPYIKIYGIYENNKSKEKISLSISGKDPLNLNGNKKNFVAELDLSKLELSHSKDHDLYKHNIIIRFYGMD